jgi:TRADD-N domain-containing protein
MTLVRRLKSPIFLFFAAWPLAVLLYSLVAFKLFPSTVTGFQQQVILGREFELECRLPSYMAVGVANVVECAASVDDPQRADDGDNVILQVRDLSFRSPRTLRLTLHYDAALHRSVSDYGPLVVTPQDDAAKSVPTSVFLFRPSNGYMSSPAAVELPVSTWPSVPSFIFLSLMIGLPILLLFFGTELLFRGGPARDLSTEEARRRIDQAAKKAEEDPGRAKYAWDLAQAKLEEYFDKNLSQVNQVFRVALGVMIIGFMLVIAAAVLSLHSPEVTPASKVSAIAGIVAQFIGATFMVMYRSTVTQANEFMSILERINTVGMAIRVLDAIPEGAAELKNQTRAAMVELLIEGHRSESPRVRAAGRARTRKASD